MKTISFFIAGLLIISSFAILGSIEAEGQNTQFQVSFSSPTITEETIKGENFVKISTQGANTYHFITGEPMLPVFTKTIVLPFGADVSSVSCSVDNTNSMQLSSRLRPAPQYAVPGFENIEVDSFINDDIYQQNKLFPDKWYSYDVGVGLDENNNHKTFVNVHIYSGRYNPRTDILQYITGADVTVSYSDSGSDPFPSNGQYDLVIIAPQDFTGDLQRLVTHKNSYGVDTLLKTTEDIYSEYNGNDKPEQIKYFIKDALETYGVSYVMLVGGLNSMIWADPRDDTNQGSKDWHVPVRYSNLEAGEPGYICDLYYADIYKKGGAFDNWDSDGDGIYAEYGFLGDTLDMYPDVPLGRLACRNTREVKILVDKIITYETSTYGSNWFEKMVTVSGDGFLDQKDLNFEWDTNGVPDGTYTIKAQSTNPEAVSGPIDTITIEKNSNAQTSINLNHDDHLQIPGFPNYPYDPIAEIMTISDGDVLGRDDYFYTPGDGEAYCNDFSGYANVEYRDGILHIRGKSYDPKPYGYSTDISVWVENSQGQTIYEDERTGTEMYSEGDWTVGEQLLNGRAGGSYYMPSNFNFDHLWSSNGELTGDHDVINSMSSGCGFAFFSGHGAPHVWANHYPGIPGNRQHAGVDGLLIYDLLSFPFIGSMNNLDNNNKYPVVAVGGCHNSMFNVSLLATFLDKDNSQYMHSYGYPTLETWSWYLTSMSGGGAIATMGNTGYGYGILGEWCTTGGLDNWITTEFFRQYGTNNKEILGDAYKDTLTSYINTFGKSDDGHAKTVQQWVLLGDPSLKIGGYENNLEQTVILTGDGMPGIPVNMVAESNQQPESYHWDLDNDGEFDDATGENIQGQWDLPGVYWVGVKAVYPSKETISHKAIEIQKDQGPAKPTAPQGPSQDLETKKAYTYTFTATDPYDDELCYLIDWGDGTQSPAGKFESGEEAYASHTYKNKGEYEIKVKTYDSYGRDTQWSDTLTISITEEGKGKMITTPLIQFLQTLLQRFPLLQQLFQNLIIIQ